ncbi:MAG: hypothetical protein ACOCZA_07975 [Spirochaetota bacterium]
MFFFWGPFFFVFPAFIIFMIVRHLIGPSQRHQRHWSIDDFYSQFESGPSRESMSKESQQVSIYKLAYRLQGRITVSDIVVETGMEAKAAEDLIQSMVDNQRVRMEVDGDGMLVYEFPEIIARLKRGEDQSP